MDNFELCLFGAYQAINSSLHITGQSFTATVDERSDIKRTVGAREKLLSNGGSAYAEYVGEYIVLSPRKHYCKMIGQPNPYTNETTLWGSTIDKTQLENMAVDFLQPDLYHVGGILETKKLLQWLKKTM